MGFIALPINQAHQSSGANIKQLVTFTEVNSQQSYQQANSINATPLLRKLTKGQNDLSSECSNSFFIDKS